MCGIAGLLKLDGRFSHSDVEAVIRMLDAQTHRGPDDWGLLLPHTVYANEEVRQLLSERGLLAERDLPRQRGTLSNLETRNPKSEIRNSSDSHIRVYRAAESQPAVILGSRRLSILDLSPRGRMPMSNANEKLWITYNGEIYNSPELREELAPGFNFHSQSDTEVIINGYDRWGDEVLSHLRGMFAFAIFDVDRGRLLLARDRFGIKPLYYSRISDFGLRNSDFVSSTASPLSAGPLDGPTPQSAIRNPQSEILVFASEVRAIVRSNLVAFEREPEATVRFLQLGSIPAPLTTIKNVFALPAGHMLSVSE